MKPLDPRTASAVEGFFHAFLDRVAGRVAIVKPQIAFFERLGSPGLQALESVVRRARERDVLVLLDAKRGDIGSTARAYAAAYLGADAALPADAVTLSPYLGRDTLEPFFEEAVAHGKGLFVLVKTSNPGSGDFQNRQVVGHDGVSRPLFETVAASLADRAAALVGPRYGFSSLGVVVGATYPEESERVRELLPRALFLVPGYGAQGASARDAVRGFVAGSDGRREGGLVSSSRGVLFPDGSDTTDAGAWERAIDAALDRATGELGEAIAG